MDRRSWLAAVAFAVVAASCGGDDGGGADDTAPLPDRSFADDAGADAEAGTPPPGDAGPSFDASMDGEAGSDAGAGCDGAAACERVVFVTSATFTGNALGGLTGADAKCQSAADGAKSARVKGRTFVAWLGTKATAVTLRMTHGTMAYVKPSGKVVATSFSDLTDGTLATAINEDEDGSAVTNSAVWTGSSAAGANGLSDCDAWSATGTKGRAGGAGFTSALWSSAGDFACTNVGRLYCFER